MPERPWVALAVGLALLPAEVCLAAQGRAVITGTSESSVLTGQADFEDTPEGLRVRIEVSQAPPGTHAVHIHEFGHCEEAGKAAGSHYNPKGVPHGELLVGGLARAHAGDFGNLKIDAQGHGSFERVYPGIRLSDGQYTVGGRAVIVHEKEDDFSQPTGNAGSRIGCGVIAMASPS